MPFYKKHVGKIIIALVVIIVIPTMFPNVYRTNKTLLSVQCENNSIDLINFIDRKGEFGYFPEYLSLAFNGSRFANFKLTGIDDNFMAFPRYSLHTKDSYRLFDDSVWDEVELGSWVKPWHIDVHTKVSTSDFLSIADCIEENIDSFNLAIETFTTNFRLTRYSGPNKIVSISNFPVYLYERNRNFMCSEGGRNGYSNYHADIELSDGKLNLAIREGYGFLRDHAFQISIDNDLKPSIEVARTCINVSDYTVDQYVAELEKSLQILDIPEAVFNRQYIEASKNSEATEVLDKSTSDIKHY